MAQDLKRRDAKNSAKRGRRPPRPLTPQRLENAALYYLGRYSASVAHFRRILLRRVARSSAVHGSDSEEGAAWVEELITRFLRAGLLDDCSWATAKTASMRRRGASALAIRQALRAKGVADDVIEQALAASGESAPDAEWRAAAALARRRRLGPYRKGATRADNQQRDLAIMARAGFSYPLARAVIGAATPDSLEAELQADSD
jgi:regulatory protein